VDLLEQDGEHKSGAASGFPGEGWPSLHAVEYCSKLILLILILLALPHLFVKLLKAPGKLGPISVGPGSVGA
jgi:hypothetical protein